MGNRTKRRYGNTVGIFIAITLFFMLILNVTGRLITRTMAESSFFSTNLIKNVKEETQNIIREQIKTTFIREKKRKHDREIAIFSDTFGGSFVDEKGNYVIELTTNDDESIKKIKGIYSGVSLSMCSFSYNYLQEIMLEIEEIAFVNTVSTVEINDKKNNVLVELSDETRIKAIVEHLVSMELYNEDAIQFVVDPNSYVTLTSSAYGGEAIACDSLTPGFIDLGTICANVIDNATGQYGVLTCEHVARATNGTPEMHYGQHFTGILPFCPDSFTNDVVIGRGARGQFSGCVDAAFIPFSTQSSWGITSKGKYNTNTYSDIALGGSATATVGATVVKIGQRTGVTTGTILSTNSTAVLNDGSLINTIRISNTVEKGDSGGPLYLVSNNKKYLIGMVVAKNETNQGGGYACHIHNVMNALNVTPITDDIIETTEFSNNEVRVNKLNCLVHSNFNIPNQINEMDVTVIGTELFQNRSQLSNISLPETLHEIGNLAFAGCTSLTAVSLPSSLTKMGFCVFDPGTQLTNYGGNAANVDLIIPSGSKSVYENNGWGNFNIVEINITTSGAISIVPPGKLHGEILIPPYLEGRLVTTIADEGFANQTEITDIGFSTIISIGNKAFYGCTNLEGAFYMSLPDETINVPDHVTSYSNYYYTERFTGVELVAGWVYTLTFDYNNLQSSSARSDVFTNLGVGENCFALDITGGTHFSSSSSGTQTIVFSPTEAQLATSKKLWCRFIRTSTPQTVSIDISNVQLYIGVRSIAIDAFENCGKLSSPGLSYRLLPNGKYAIEGSQYGLISLYYALSGTLFIPSTYNGIEVERIDPEAFCDEEILRWAFFQSGLQVIGDRAFQFCSNLKVVNLSATSVTRIEDYTFDTCPLGAFLFPQSLSYIGEGAFIRAGKVGSLPNSVTTIGDYAFSYRTVQTMTLPTNLVTIGNYAFYQTAPYGVNSIPATVTSVGSRAFSCSKFSSDYVLSPNSALYSIGSYAFNNSGITNIVLSSTVTSIGSCAFGENSGLTIYTSYGSKPAGWNDAWNNNLRPVVWGCALSSDGSYVVSFTKSASNPDNLGNGIINPIRRNYNFKGWYTTPDFSDTNYSTILEAPNGVLYAKWNEQSCVAEGTLITLADGSHVAVEDLTGEEELLVWNLLTGQFDSAPILFVDSDPYRTYEITHLFFSDGTEVKVIDEHAFWDINLNKYVFIRNDAARYIGHWFSKQDEDSLGNMVRTTVQLVDVQVYEEQTTAWSPVTYGHLCFYVNDMLSMPGATEGLINIFDVDATTMTYDAVAFAADVAEYGLFTYEEFAALIPVPEVVFDAFNGQYLKISIGKGLITLAQIAFLIDRYSVFFA